MLTDLIEVVTSPHACHPSTPHILHIHGAACELELNNMGTGNKTHGYCSRCLHRATAWSLPPHVAALVADLHGGEERRGL